MRSLRGLLSGVRGAVRARLGPTAADEGMLSYAVPPRLVRELEGLGLSLAPPVRRGARPGPEALDAAARVLAAHRAAAEGAAAAPRYGPAGLWAPLLDASFRELTCALASSEPARVAATLEDMLATPVTTGLSMGGEAPLLASSRGRRFYARRWVDGLLSLGASLGLSPESMELGQPVLRSGADALALHEALAARLGVELAFPRVCGAWGLELRGGLLPRVAWRHLRSARALLDLGQGRPAPRIVEVGGGFGGVALWTWRLSGGRARYAIYDFPLLNAIAGYFLLRALPGARVVLHGERFDARDESPHLALRPSFTIEEEPDRGADLTFNQDSLPEMSADAARLYLARFDRIARVGFYSENHESGHAWRAGDPTSAQLRLPDLEGSLVRLRRAWRFRAWMRRGYVESFYAPAPSAP